MALDNITALLSNDNTRNKLLDLVDDQYVLNLSLKVHQEEKARIALEFKSLGLKQFEFNKFVKYLKEDQSDLLNYERGLLEQIVILRGFIDNEAI